MEPEYNDTCPNCSVECTLLFQSTATDPHRHRRGISMRIVGLCFLLLGMFTTGCASHNVVQETKEQVFYYDRNRDGEVDLERHRYPGTADADWELRDDNFDGRYEKKILYGVGVFESTVDLPVPTNVHIEPNP
jgi:hypothetical protein